MFCRIEKYYASQILYAYRRKGEYKSKKQYSQKVATVKLYNYVKEYISLKKALTQK